MELIFHRRISSASAMAFDPNSRQINFTTQMYNSKTGSQEMRTVGIDEEEWLALVKYGEEAGFSQ